MNEIDDTRFRFNSDVELNLNFYQMPIFLFDEEFKDMPNDCKILYSIIKDQYNLSIKYNWFDEENRVFCTLGRDEMCILMNRSKDVVAKIIKKLIDFELIMIENGGFGKKRRIYLKYKNYEKDLPKDYTKNRLYYTKNNVMNEIYYPLLKKLLTEEKYKLLSNDAKVLYSILRSRHNLSFENAKDGKWLNNEGQVFFKFSRNNMCKFMNRTEKTVIDYMKELVQFNLIQEEQTKHDKSKSIFLTYSIDEMKNPEKVISKTLETSKINSGRDFTVSEVDLLQYQRSTFYSTSSRDFTVPEVDILHTNNTNFNNINSNDIKSSHSHVKSEADRTGQDFNIQPEIEFLKLQKELEEMKYKNLILENENLHLKKEQDKSIRPEEKIYIAKNSSYSLDDSKYNKSFNGSGQAKDVKVTDLHKYEFYKELIEKNINYDWMKINYNDKKDFINLCDTFIRIVSNNMANEKDKIFVSNEKGEISKALFNKQMERLDHDTFMFAINQYIKYSNEKVESGKKIYYPEKYIITCIYNSLSDSKIKDFYMTI